MCYSADNVCLLQQGPSSVVHGWPVETDLVVCVKFAPVDIVNNLLLFSLGFLSIKIHVSEKWF